jgi:transposase-like protein
MGQEVSHPDRRVVISRGKLLSGKPMTDAIRCPECHSENVMFRKKRNTHVCEECDHKFTLEKPFVPHRVFLSYGHDEHVSLAIRLAMTCDNEATESGLTRNGFCRVTTGNRSSSRGSKTSRPTSPTAPCCCSLPRTRSGVRMAIA